MTFLLFPLYRFLALDSFFKPLCVHRSGGALFFFKKREASSFTASALLQAWLAVTFFGFFLTRITALKQRCGAFFLSFSSSPQTSGRREKVYWTTFIIILPSEFIIWGASHLFFFCLLGVFFPPPLTSLFYWGGTLVGVRMVASFLDWLLGASFFRNLSYRNLFSFFFPKKKSSLKGRLT